MERRPRKDSRVHDFCFLSGFPGSRLAVILHHLFFLSGFPGSGLAVILHQDVGHSNDMLYMVRGMCLLSACLSI